MSIKPTTVSQSAPCQDSQFFFRWQKAPFQRDLINDFCYHCGEDGHLAPKCNAAENYQKVI